jgi:hypothetical protein
MMGGRCSPRLTSASAVEELLCSPSADDLLKLCETIVQPETNPADPVPIPSMRPSFLVSIKHRFAEPLALEGHHLRLFERGESQPGRGVAG